MHKFTRLFVCLTLISILLSGCNNKKNSYKEHMEEWFSDAENQADVLNKDSVSDVLLGIIDEDGNVVSNDVLDFSDGQSLYDVLEENSDKFTLAGSDSEYGFYLTGINNILTDYSKDGSYISIWINGEYAQYGVSGLLLHDNDVIAIVYMI